jgi:hypothetical protein
LVVAEMAALLLLAQTGAIPFFPQSHQLEAVVVLPIAVLV